MTPDTQTLIVSLIIPLATILMSGVVAGLVTFKLNATRQDKQFLRQKLEDFFIAIHEYCRNKHDIWQSVADTFEKGLDPSPMPKTIEDLANILTDRMPYGRAQMLSGIYFPTLNPLVNEMEELISRTNSTLQGLRNEFHAQYQSTGLASTVVSDHWSKEIRGHMNALVDIENRAKAEVIQIAKTI